MEVAALGLKVEGVDSIDRARDSLGRFVKAAQDAEKSTEGVKDSSGRARDEFGRFKKSTDDAAKGASGLGKESEKASKSIFGFGRSSDSAASSMNSLGSTATKVGGVLAAAFSITKVVQYADAWSDMQSRVGAATGQMDLAAGNMQRLLQIANASYSPLQQTSAVYARNVATFRDLGRSAAEAADFTEAVNNAMVTTATRGQDAEVVINSLSRALATGKLDADAFDTIVSRSPRTLKAVADEMGVTTSALRKLATDGKVTSDVIARGLTGSLEALRAEAAEMPATMGDAFVRVGNNMTAFVGIMDQATGASGSLANGIISVSDAALEIATSGDVIAGFVAWKGTIEAIAQDFVSLGNIISDFTDNTLGDVNSISFSFGEMPANIRAMIKIAVVEIASFIDAQMNGIRALGAAIEALPSGPAAAMDAFNAVRAQMEQLGQVRLDSINDILAERDAIIQAGRDAANSYAETGRKALEFNGAVGQTAGTVGTLTKEQEKAAKALSDFVAQSALSVSNAAAMTAAYLSGSEAVAKATREQKIEAEVLKLGEKNRAEVTRRINEMEDALESLDLAKSIAQMRDQNKELTSYGKVLALGGTATKAGREALKQYNNEREIEAALVGKTSAEITKLIPKLREEQKLRDSLRGGNARIEKLNALVSETRTVTEKANAELAELAELAASTKDPVYLDAINRKMQEVQASTSEWGQFTERALDSVDQAFAGAWKNIDQGFSGFADGLKNAFKNLLAELAHMAITRPIIMQIGSALGIGGMSGQSSGLWGMLGGDGGSGGGSGLGGMVSTVSKLYSLYQGTQGEGLLGAMWKGYQGEGLGGVFSGAAGYYGNMLGGINQSLGQIYGTITNGGGMTYAPLSYQVGNSGAGSALSTLSTYAPYILAAWQGYQTHGVKGAVVQGGMAYAGGLGGAAVGAAAAGAMSGTAFGATYGSYFGPIGTAIGAIIGTLLGGALLGGGDNYKRQVGSAQGVYRAGEYTGTGAVESWFGTSRRFGEDFDQQLHGMNEAFASSLGGLFEMFDIDSDIMTTAAGRLRRTSGRLAAEFHASFEGQTVSLYGQYGRKGNTQESTRQWFDDVLGRGLSQAIGKSSLPAYLKELTGGLTTAEQVGTAIGGLFQRFDGTNAALESLRLSAFEMTDAGLRGADSLLNLSAAIAGLEDPTAAEKIASLTSLTGTYYDKFFTDVEKTEDTLKAVARAFEAADIELAGSRAAYRAMVEDIDLTTDAGRQMFTAMMALSGQAATYYEILEQRAAQAQSAVLAGMQTYYDQFRTDALKTADVLAGVVEQFAALELTLPSARDGFIAAVDALDTSTEAGKRMFETLMSVAGAADSYYDILEQRARDAVSSSWSLLERSVSAEKSALTEAYQKQKAAQDAVLQQQRSARQQYQQAQAASYRDMAQTVSATASALGGLSNSLSSALGRLLDQSTDTLIQRRSASVMQLQNALRTGNLSNTDQLAEAARIAGNVDSGQYATLADYEREQGRTANLLAELGDLTASRKTAAEQQVEQLQKLYDQANSTAQSLGQSIGSVKTSVDTAYEEQIKALDEQLALAKSQIDALNGIDNSVVSVSDAIKSLATAISAAIEQIPGLSDISIPGFATGGAFTNGIVSRPTAFNMGVMGEAGAEGVLPLANIGGRLGVHANIGGKDTAELQAVRAELSEMKRVLVEIMWSSKETATATRNLDEGGVVIDNSGAVMA